ncbi:MAG: AsmA family protein [Verrucomicrobiae bacterium]|nr:AsmA family protein [Verrucomicrobiae bacterium]
MKKLLRILLVVVVLVCVFLVGAVLFINHRLQSPETQRLVISAAQDAIGAKVQINELSISLFRGIRLRGVTVANPQGFDGALLTADEFVLRYNLLPLLRRRLEIETMALRKPVVRLVRNEKGQWNYEQLGAKAAPEAVPGESVQPEPAASGPSSPVKESSAAPSVSAPGLDITLSRLAVEQGEIVMIGEKGKELVRIQNLTVQSRLQTTGAKLEGEGRAKVEILSVANAVFARNLAAPIKILTERITLTPVSGTLAGGAIGGEITLRLSGGFQYGVNVKLKDADMAKLLQEARAKPTFSGKLQAESVLTGTGGLPTINGSGRLEIHDGMLAGVPVLETLAALLRINELRNLRFTECRMEFSMADNKMPTPVIRLVSPQVQITGKGVVSLADYSLNHDVTLAVAPDLLAKVPGEIRGIFQKQPDGFLAISFKVTGPYDAPKNDIAETLLKGAAQNLLQKGLQKLFR